MPFSPGLARSSVSSIGSPSSVELDKARYLVDLRAADVPIVPTSFVASGERLTPCDGPFVVEPSISAGGRMSARFGAERGRRGRSAGRTDPRRWPGGDGATIRRRRGALARLRRWGVSAHFRGERRFRRAERPGLYLDEQLARAATTAGELSPTRPSPARPSPPSTAASISSLGRCSSSSSSSPRSTSSTATARSSALPTRSPRRSADGAFRRLEPAPADEAGERPDDAPIASERAASVVVDRGDPRLRRGTAVRVTDRLGADVDARRVPCPARPRPADEALRPVARECPTPPRRPPRAYTRPR